MTRLKVTDRTVYRVTAIDEEALSTQADTLRRKEALANENFVVSPITEVLHQMDRRVFCARHNEDGDPWIECSKHSIDGVILLCAVEDYPELLKVEHINKTGNLLDDDYGLDHPHQDGYYYLDKQHLTNFQVPPVDGFFAIGDEVFRVVEDLGSQLTVFRQKANSDLPTPLLASIIHWQRSN